MPWSYFVCFEKVIGKKNSSPEYGLEVFRNFTHGHTLGPTNTGIKCLRFDRALVSRTKFKGKRAD